MTAASIRSATASYDTSFMNPCTAAESRRFARALWLLLDSLDGEIVVAALVGERLADLLDAERQEVDRVREFLNGRIAMRSEPTDLRRRALAVLDSFVDQVESAAEGHQKSPYVARAVTRYVAGAFCVARRWMQRKAGIRQATAPLAPSDTTGEAGATAPAPASPFMCTSRLFAGIPGNFFCTRGLGHDGKHGYAGIFWTDGEVAR